MVKEDVELDVEEVDEYCICDYGKDPATHGVVLVLAVVGQLDGLTIQVYLFYPFKSSCQARITFVNINLCEHVYKLNSD